MEAADPHVTALRIDRNFITERPRDDAAAIVTAIIQLGRAVDITTIADGVETRQQAA